MLFKTMASALCFAASLLLLMNVCVASLQSEYENKVILSPEYNLYWTYNSSQAQLYFATEVQTLGWVGLGFTYSINTNMDGYDVAIGYLHLGQRGDLKDYMTAGHTNPSIDMQQDFRLQSAAHIGKTTVLKFKRYVNTNDRSSKDVYIKPGPITVVWAYRNVAVIGHHDARGWKDITLYTDNSKGAANSLSTGSSLLITALIIVVAIMKMN